MKSVVTPWLRAACAALTCMTLCPNLKAAPSFCSAHVHTIELGTGDQTKKVTVVMDHENPYHWYYFPNELTIGYKNGKPEFSLIQFQFENPDRSASAPDFLEGGILQFSVTMDLGDLGDELESKITSILRSQKDPITKQLLQDVKASQVRLTAMPFDEVRVGAVAAPGDDKSFVKVAHVPQGTGPAYGTQKMPMTFELSRMGANIFTALTTEARTGVQVLYNVKYTGMTPDIGFNVHVDWEKTYNHFSHEETHRTSVAGNLKGVDVEAAIGVSNKDIAQKLIETGAITVDVTEGGEVFNNPLAVATYLDPLLAKIYEKIFEGGAQGFEMLSKEQSASAKEAFTEDLSIDGLRQEEKKANPGAAKPGSGADATGDGSAGGNQPAADSGGAERGPSTDAPNPIGDLKDVVTTMVPAIKSETNIALLKIENFSSFQADFSFTARSYQQRNAAIGGFIGIGNWREDVQDDADPDGKKHRQEMLKEERMLLTVGEGNWESNSFRLPDLDADFGKLGIQSCTVGVILMDDNGKPVQVGSGTRRAATWNVREKDRGWQGNSVNNNRMLWSLKQQAEDYGRDRLQKFEYQVDVTLRTQDDVGDLRFQYDTPLLTGESSLASPLAQATIVDLDVGKLLEFRDAYLKVTVVAGDQTTTLRFPDANDANVKRKAVILPPDTNRFGVKADLTLDELYESAFVFNNTSSVKLSGDDFGRLVRIDASRLVKGDTSNFAEFSVEAGDEVFELEFLGDEPKETWRQYIILPRDADSYNVVVEAEVGGEIYEGSFDYTSKTKLRYQIKNGSMDDYTVRR